MPDHFHLLLTPALDVSFEKSVQLVKGGFSFRVKKEVGVNLEVWEKGYTEHRVKDSTDYQRHADYIRENLTRCSSRSQRNIYGTDLNPRKMLQTLSGRSIHMFDSGSGVLEEASAVGPVSRRAVVGKGRPGSNFDVSAAIK
jgi:hypothetical protein